MGSGKVTKRSIAGSSSWSTAYIYTTEGGKKVFVKQSSHGDETMFRGEALGLQAMHGLFHWFKIGL
jgi:fructosamine-3-kinase